MGKNCIMIFVLAIIFACFSQAALACEPHDLTKTGTLVIKFNNLTDKQLVPFSCIVESSSKEEFSKIVYQSTTVKSDQEIILENLNQGEYTITVNALLFGCEVKPCTVKVLAGNQTDIQLDIKNMPSGTLNVIAADAVSGIGVSDAIIDIYYNSIKVHSVKPSFQTVKNAIELPIGEYTLRVSQQPQGYKTDKQQKTILVSDTGEATVQFNFVRLAPNGKVVVVFTLLCFVAILFVTVWCYCKNKK